MSLTSKQEKFAQAIVDGLNQSDAYRLAYDADAMGSTTVTNEASKLAADHDIAARVTYLKGAIQAQFIGQQAEILRELQGVAFSDLSHLVSWNKDGITLKDSVDLPPELTRLVSEVGETRNKYGMITGIKIKLHSKLDAIDKLLKATGGYTASGPVTEVKITRIEVRLNMGKGPDDGADIVDVETYTVHDASARVVEEPEDASNQ